MKKHCLIGLIATFCLTGSLFAQDKFQEGGVFTLQECIELGLKHNTEIKKAQLDEEAANYQRKEIIGTGLPQVDAYGDYNNFLDVYPQAIPGGVLDPNTDPSDINVIAFGVPQSMKAGAQISQLIFSQSYLVGLKAAKTSEQFYRLLTQMTEEDIVYDVALNYYSVISTELQMDNLEANHDQLKRLEEIIKSQYENDLARKVDYNRVKVNLTTLETEMDNLEITIEQRKNYLKLVMGIPVNTPISLEEYDFKDNLSPLQALQVDADLSQRYDLQVLGKQQELNDLNINNIKSGYYPTLSAFADVNYNAFSTEFDFLSSSHMWYRGALIGLKLSVPIFDGFQKKNKIAQASVEGQKIKYDQYMAEQNAEAEYLNAVKKLKNSIRSLQAQESNLQLSEDVLQQTGELYREGLSPLTDLLDAETTLRQARSSYYRQIINVKTAEADLYKSTGQIEKIIKN
ncbi:TolC family protein [Echinicola sp. CAU 1574]|uniref:TolC family protein n=1 Tax=Echinicola arenosa TaxID=2774144 RepID=A0ABR9ALG9_9BACT|nr:TolC family protein [Echinicola arenosa]MBD8489641.1 TolC family protein [Echinicola arenosa]